MYFNRLRDLKGKFREHLVNFRAHTGDIHCICRPGNKPIAVINLSTLQQSYMAISVTPDIDRKPGSVHPVLVVLTKQHSFDLMLPEAKILLVLRNNWANIAPGTTGNCIPSTTDFRNFPKCILGDDLTHGITLAVGSPEGIRIVRVSVLIDHRSSNQPDF